MPQWTDPYNLTDGHKLRIVDDNLRAEIENLIEMLIPVRQIAEECFVSTSTVYNVRRAMGIHGRIPGLTLADKLPADDIVQQYRNEVPIRKMCEEHGVSPTVIYAVLQKAGEPIRKYSSIYQEARKRRMDEAVEMYKAGMFVHEIVEASGVHQPVLHKELRRRGVPLRAPRKPRQRASSA